MVIASKLPPYRTERTYFHSGRAAFAYLLTHRVRASRVFLPAYTCWSLVSTLQRRFPDVEIVFYPVGRDLRCTIPLEVDASDVVVLIHFFGYANDSRLPRGSGTIFEDISHALFSRIDYRGDYVFGSLQKIARVADGGFVNGFYNPQYEPSRKLDTWLRYESTDWRDMREAENMIDREWQLCDMSSQSMAVVMSMDADRICKQRRANEEFLSAKLGVGRALREFNPDECPLLHQRLFDATEERDSLRIYLAERKIFCSIHWPTHPLVRASQVDIGDAIWLEEHSLAIPVGSDYGEAEMEAIVRCAEAWQHAGA
ncbi:MAG: hypothetical protein O2931_11895 [Planctomycetota bacterium]|nr:hypothetical protein [Planctomycetota bacterium]MDA1179489.1 hypothetical protein [Planctomycetota bacterium]